MLQTLHITEAQAVVEFLEMRTEQSFAVLFESLYPKLLSFFLIRGASKWAAEELTQDVLWSVYRNVDALRDRSLFFGWLFHIARNQLLQYFRKHQHDPALVSIDDPRVSGDCRTWAEQDAADVEFKNWLRCLEDQEREIIMLRYLEELRYHEIAKALDIPLGTVKWKIFNAKSKLGKSLKEAERV